MPPRKQMPEPKPLTGFAIGPKANRTKKYVCDLEGFEGFEITTKRLTFADINELPSADTTYEEAWKVIYPMIVGWNAQAMTEAGDWEDVPPPSEAGPEVFMLIEPEVNTWIWANLKYGHLGGTDLPKKLTPSESSPETAGDTSSDS